MGILDSFRKNRENKKEQTTPPPRGHSLNEILQDKSKSHIFGKLLERDGNEDLAQRLAKGELEEGDIDLLERQRLIFSEKMVQVEKIEKALTKETVIDLARNNPEFEKIINLVGPDKALKAIQSQLKDIAVTDEGRFTAIMDSVDTYNSYRNGEYKRLNDEVEKMCKDGKFTPKEYLDALAIEDPEEKEKALRELSKRTYGNFKKALHFISRGKLFSKKGPEELKTAEISIEASMTELDSHTSQIGASLFTTISGNDSMRNAVFSELVNDRAPTESKSSFVDAKKEIPGALDEVKFQKDWQEYKKKAGEKGLDIVSTDGLDLIKDAFLDKQKEDYREANKENKGFWHSIIEAIIEGMITNNKNTLK